MSVDNIDARKPRMPEQLRKSPDLGPYFDNRDRVIHDLIVEIKALRDRIAVLESA